MNGETFHRKKPDKAEVMIKHPREQKNFLKKKIAKKNSKSILLGTFDFDPEEYLDKSLLFDLKKTREEKIFNVILEKIPNNDTYYGEHREGTNAFPIRKDKKQAEKDDIIKVIENMELKMKKSTNKSRISQLKRYRKEFLNKYSSLGETFVDIDDEKTETLDKLLDLDRKLASGEIKKMLR